MATLGDRKTSPCTRRGPMAPPASTEGAKAAFARLNLPTAAFARSKAAQLLSTKAEQKLSFVCDSCVTWLMSRNIPQVRSSTLFFVRQ